MNIQPVLNEVAQRSRYIRIKSGIMTVLVSHVIRLVALGILFAVMMLAACGEYHTNEPLQFYVTLAVAFFVLVYVGHNLPFSLLCNQLHGYGGDEEYLKRHYYVSRNFGGTYTLSHSEHELSFSSRIVSTFRYNLWAPLAMFLCYVITEC